MEVINYIGYKNYENSFERAVKNWTALFQKKRNHHLIMPKKNRSLNHSLAINFNFHDVLLSCGNIFDFIVKNAVFLAKCSVIFACLVVALVFFAKNFHYEMKLHSPILLFEEIDIKELNRLMNEFALVDENDFSEDGTLFGENSNFSNEVFSKPVTFQNYTVQSGNTISSITKKFGLKNISTLIAVNNISNVRQLSAGQKLKVPSIDGLFYTVQSGNSLESIAKKYNVTVEELLDVNELENEVLKIGSRLFIPRARLDTKTLQNALGELFKCPLSVKWRLSSPFGHRLDPITGVSSNHTGIDMACPKGTTIMASNSGTVSYSGYSNIFGNYVIINHANGYQTLYAHMSKVLAKKGQFVSQGTQIGLVGSTGYSTGPHLHFTVYKNGRLVNPVTLIK